MSNNSSERVLELFLRAQLDFGAQRQQRKVIDHLTELEESGQIDDFDVTVWGREISPDGPLQGTEFHDRLLDRVHQFEEWADKNGVSTKFTFYHREATSRLIDDSYTVIGLPVICLAEYEGDELCGIYPCHEGGELCTVHDFLGRMGHELETSPL